MVSGYEVSLSESNGQRRVVATQGASVLSVTIEQLNPATDYTVYVHTLAGLGNDQTRSRPGSISQTTDGVVITVDPIADTSITVSWVPSTNPITEYQFIYDPPISPGDSSSTVPISNSPMKRLDGLTPGQNYKLTVNTVNAAEL